MKKHQLIKSKKSLGIINGYKYDKKGWCWGWQKYCGIIHKGYKEAWPNKTNQ